jgi:hypothetical protein
LINNDTDFYLLISPNDWQNVYGWFQSTL